MTKINKLVMKGFKSFANKTEFLFGDQYNCVIGPNGSGKSNVIDSLCFVLGRGSAKSLRAEKSANLIYNGGKKKKPADKGEVSIYFSNDNKLFPIPENELKITRIVKKNGTSTYKINDKTKTKQEVLDLLSHGKINPDGFNIVLQGDIIKFVEMSGIERRKIIEEISGIGVYEEKKQKAIRELEKVESKINEAEIILTERSTYLKELKKERDQANKYNELNTKISTNKASYLHKKISNRLKSTSDIDKKIEDNNSKLNKVNDEITQLNQLISSKKQDIEDINKEIEEKGENEQIKLHKEIEYSKVEIAKSTTRIETIKQEIEKIKKRKQDLKNDLDDNKTQINNFNKEKSSLEKLKLQKNKDLEIVKNQLNKFKLNHELDSATNIDKEIEEIDRLIEEKEKIISKLREEQQNILREKDRNEFKLNSIDEKISKVKEISKENKQQLVDLKNKKSLFKKLTLELNDRLNQDSKYGAEISNSRKKLMESQERMIKLESKNSGINAKLSSNASIKLILDNKNKLKGVYGTVSELGSVSTKYAQALEIAAGNRIKNIVVEDDLVATKAINFLKDKRMGVASFIPLNKIRSAPPIQEYKDFAKNKQGVHGFALDLITFDSKFKKVFSYVFGNTLVVDNLEVARRIGIGKIKMVTLEGDSCEISGVMKGGFRAKKPNIGFQQKELVKELDELRNIVGKFESLLQQSQQNRLSNEERIQELRKQKSELEGEIIKTEKSLHLEGDDLDLTLELKEKLDKQIDENETKLRELQNKITTVNRDLAQNKIKKTELRNKIGQLRNPRLIAELNSFEEKKQELNKQIIEIDAKINAFESQYSMINRDHHKINEIIKQHEKEIDKFNFELIRLKEKTTIDKKELAEKEKQVKHFYSQYNDLFKKRTKLSDEISKLENKENNLNDVSRKCEIQMNVLSLENAKLKSELAGLESEFKNCNVDDKDLDVKKSEQELKSEIDRWERAILNMGNVNMKALEIYTKVEEEYNSLIDKKEKLKVEKSDVLMLMQEIESRKKEMFMKTYEVLNKNFQEIFLKLSKKGEAFLQIENPDEIFENGLFIKVRLSGQKYLDIRSLSGGEKTMTALAFIFAIQEHDPHSFYVLDEVDAALDKHNSELLSKLVRKYSDNAQYVVISHNDGVIQEADNVYGLSMNEFGVSKVISLEL